MDPTAVLKMVWSQRYWVLPVILLTIASAAFVLQFGPRTYESTMSYAVVSPAITSDAELARQSDLRGLNADNPYLRSSYPSLISDVVITRVNSQEVADQVGAGVDGVSYSVSPGPTGNGFIIDITGEGNTKALATSTTTLVGSIFEQELYEVQKVHNADDRYLFSALPLTRPSAAAEQFSSRLRSVIMILLAGGVLMFGAVSVGSAVSASGSRRREPPRYRGLDPGAGPGRQGRASDTTPSQRSTVSSPH